jgi:hypothetical protein
MNQRAFTARLRLRVFRERMMRSCETVLLESSSFGDLVNGEGMDNLFA